MSLAETIPLKSMQVEYKQIMFLRYLTIFRLTYFIYENRRNSFLYAGRSLRCVGRWTCHKCGRISGLLWCLHAEYLHVDECTWIYTLSIDQHFYFSLNFFLLFPVFGCYGGVTCSSTWFWTLRIDKLRCNDRKRSLRNTWCCKWPTKPEESLASHTNWC